MVGHGGIEHGVEAGPGLAREQIQRCRDGLLSDARPLLVRRRRRRPVDAAIGAAAAVVRGQVPRPQPSESNSRRTGTTAITATILAALGDPGRPHLAVRQVLAVAQVQQELSDVVHVRQFVRQDLGHLVDAGWRERRSLCGRCCCLCRCCWIIVVGFAKESITFV